MNERRLAGAVAGGLVAGLALTVMLVDGERKSGKPSELADLERDGAAKLGREVPGASELPRAGEQALIQGGHLLLSAAAGAAYAFATEENARVVPGGIGFGLAFYAAMHWIAGPLLGLKKPEWRADKGTIAMHTANHVAFGLITAAGAKLFTR